MEDGRGLEALLRSGALTFSLVPAVQRDLCREIWSQLSWRLGASSCVTLAKLLPLSESWKGFMGKMRIIKLCSVLRIKWDIEAIRLMQSPEPESVPLLGLRHPHPHFSHLLFPFLSSASF